jgi:hypothetical protein
LAERFYRAHLGLNDRSKVYNSDELGLITSPYPRWRAYKHHQWMIITPHCATFLRENVDSLNFLAFAEHIYIPDESFFATGNINFDEVLINSPIMRDLIFRDNKRYLRFSKGHSHPSWLGLKDRYLFPAYEPEPSFFFIRKMNFIGKLYDEKSLAEWISKTHFSNPPHTNCTMEDASVLDHCLLLYAKKISIDNELIIIPTNTGYLKYTENLVCSLAHFGITNIIYWSLDHAVHDQFLSKGQLSIFFPGFPTDENILTKEDLTFVRMMRYKNRMISLVLNLGFHVWYLDADIVVLSDFRYLAVDDKSSDVFIAVDETYKEPKTSVPSTSTMYFRNSENSKSFMKGLGKALQVAESFDDLKALKWMLRDSTKYQLIYPNKTNVFSSDKVLPPDNSHQRIKVDIIPTLNVSTPSDKIRKESNINDNQTTINNIINGTVNITGTKEDTTGVIDMEIQNLNARGLNGSTVINVKVFDPLLFVNGELFTDNSPLPKEFIFPILIHFMPHAEVELRDWDLWFIGGVDKNECIWNDPKLRILEMMAKKALV